MLEESAPAQELRGGVHRSLRSNLTWALFTALSWSAWPAVGQAAERAEAPDAAAEHDAPLPPGDEPRATPEYRAHAAPTGAAQKLLWVPRIALFPLYVASEYGLRRPVGAAVALAERHHLRARWHEFFTFNDEQTIGIFPTGSLDLALRPRAGAYFFWLDFLPGSDVKWRLITGGLDAWSLNTLVQTRFDRWSQLRFTFDFSQQPDRLYYGIGREVRHEAARFRERRHWARLTHTWRQPELQLGATFGYLAAEFDPNHEELGDEALADAIASGKLLAPPALHDGVVAAYSGLRARYDTRPGRLATVRSLRDLQARSATGFSLDGHATHFAGLASTRASVDLPARVPHWLRYGTTALAVLDITATHRTLELEAVVELAEPLPSDNPIPFTELVSLGGDHPLRAFNAGHLIDRSAAVATVRYSWPIWLYLDGHLHYAVGNVFGSQLAGFAPERLRSSFGLGMDSVGSPDHPFEALIAFGTRPFDEGGGIETFRLVIGTRAGF